MKPESYQQATKTLETIEKLTEFKRWLEREIPRVWPELKDGELEKTIHDVIKCEILKAEKEFNNL